MKETLSTENVPRKGNRRKKMNKNNTITMYSTSKGYEHARGLSQQLKIFLKNSH